MLTKDDLGNIGQLIDQKMNKRFKEQDARIEERFLKHESLFDRKLKPIHRKLDRLQKDLTTTIDFFDHEVIDLKTRMDRVENHLQLS